jgi:hypothetical protein
MLRTYRYAIWLVSIAIASWVLAFAFWPSHSHAQQTGPIYCSQQATSPAGFTTKVQVVAPPGTGSADIWICGYTVSAVAASVVTFQTGTGTNCATNSQAIGPTIQLGATSTFGDTSSTFRGFLIQNPNALCATASTAANITVYYQLQ